MTLIVNINNIYTRFIPISIKILVNSILLCVFDSLCVDLFILNVNVSKYQKLSKEEDVGASRVAKDDI